ncbi:conserved protein of unknown function [Candidatus Filomicrobium marinum]|uniref:UPF0262 protein YBN1229_v1_1982 n=2 Tax=Filomicrobium TaxID=119044 RepID=A0A0D6JEW1_9HYPH|nr:MULTISPECIES: UPF0262 family protein [Filomicrobium]CFX23451.1 conserved protein of unknown function [Candidatus Filomicrobium marinum]CPR19049.1 conserved protein of unknown function [Candidatus Filomicrobium marinum]SDO10786.1 Uncharacterized protein, UPF0262 family [Filomicrobium insigne]
MSEFLPSPHSTSRLYEITLDEKSIARNNSNVDHEREVAIFDILECNEFKPVEVDNGPYRLHLSIIDDRLNFNIGNEAEHNLVVHVLSLTPFKRIIKDYFLVCDSYYAAIRNAPPSRIQAIDQSRRNLHDEGSRVLAERLEGKVKVDFDTARRLFTLICALHWKG